MPDDPTPPNPDPQADPPADPPQDPPTDPREADLPDNVKEILAKNRQAAREADRRAKEAEDRVKKFEDRDKSELEKANEKATTAERDARAASENYLRLKVGTEKGLPPNLAERLKGSTEEEMAKDADELLKTVKPSSNTPPNFDGGPRQPAPEGEDMNTLLRRAAGRE